MRNEHDVGELDAQYLKEEDHTSFKELLETYDAGVQDGDIQVGDRIRGTILSVGGEFAFVDFGGRSEAVIAVGELRDDEGEPQYGVGDEIEAFVASLDEGVRLTFSLRAYRGGLELLQQAYKADIPLKWMWMQ